MYAVRKCCFRGTNPIKFLKASQGIVVAAMAHQDKRHILKIFKTPELTGSFPKTGALRTFSSFDKNG